MNTKKKDIFWYVIISIAATLVFFYAIFQNSPRTATVKAVSYCDLYSLSKSEFDMVVEQHPEIADGLKMKLRYVLNAMKYFSYIYL